MADTKARIIALVAGVSRKEAKEDSFTRVSICRYYLQLPPTHRTPELAIFVPTTTDTTDYFTPAAHARGVTKLICFLLYTADFRLVDRRTLNPFHTCALQ